MKEAEVDAKIAASNNTYFVPVDRSAPASGDSANDVVSHFSPSTTKNQIFQFFFYFAAQDIEVPPVVVENDQDAAVRVRRQATIVRMDMEPVEKKEMNDVVRSHIVPGIYLTPDLRDEQVRHFKYFCFHSG